MAYSGVLCDYLQEASPGFGYFGPQFLFAHGCMDLLQGVLSYGSDVVFMGVPSAFHLADRALAIVLTLAGVYIEVAVLLFGGLPLPARALMVALLAGGLHHHFRAKAAIRSETYRQYVTSHTIWHLAIAASLPLPAHLALAGVFGRVA